MALLEQPSVISIKNGKISAKKNNTYLTFLFMFILLMYVAVRQRRKSRGEEDEEEEEEGVFEDPKIKREIEELKKFKDESGIGKVIYNELEVAKTLPMKPLDPWKSSRAPNAKYEPKFQTRYQSPMFACEYVCVDLMFT